MMSKLFLVLAVAVAVVAVAAGSAAAATPIAAQPVPDLVISSVTPTHLTVTNLVCPPLLILCTSGSAGESFATAWVSYKQSGKVETFVRTLSVPALGPGASASIRYRPVDYPQPCRVIAEADLKISWFAPWFVRQIVERDELNNDVSVDPVLDFVSC
jgi:hypothetical protein